MKVASQVYQVDIGTLMEFIMQLADMANGGHLQVVQMRLGTAI